MNTGMQDAYNLGWKLAFVCRRGAGEALLDSYGAERLPVGHRLLGTTDRLFAGLTSGSRGIAFARDKLFPLAASWVVRSRARRAAVFRFISERGISYRGGPAVLADTGPGLRSGDRAPDGLLRDASGAAVTLFSRLTGPQHHLLAWSSARAGAEEIRALSAAGSALQAELGEELRVHEIALAPRPDALVAEAALAARWGVSGPALHLVRPDGYLAGRVAGVSPAPLLALLRRILR